MIRVPSSICCVPGLLAEAACSSTKSRFYRLTYVLTWRRSSRLTMSYGEIPGDVPHYAAPGGLAGYYLPVKGNRPVILFGLYKPFDNTTTSRRHDYLG